MKDDLTAARLDLIAAKARILAEQYKNGQLWAGDLSEKLGEISIDINSITRGRDSGWGSVSTGGTWYPSDK